MRRLFAWIAGAVGGLAAYRLVARRRDRAALEPPAPPGEVDPRAEALRAKLDESRQPDVAEPEKTALAAPAAEVEEPEAAEFEGGDPDVRRRAVHDHGRTAVEEMRAGEETSEDP